MLPFNTTLITVLRSSEADTGDGYPDAEPTWSPVVRDVRAVISRPSGTFVQAGTVQEVVALPLSCDPCDLQHTDRVLDQSDQVVYKVKFVKYARGFGLDAMKAELQYVGGFV